METERQITPEMRRARQRERFQRSMRRVAGRALADMRSLECPADISYFLNLLEDGYVNLKDMRNRSGRPKIGLFCMMSPYELIYAAGAVPMRLDTSAFTTTFLADDEIPKDACSLVKSTLGMQKLGLLKSFDDIRLALLPPTCDCKRRMLEPLSRYLPVAPFNIAYQKRGDDRIAGNLLAVRQLKNTLEETTGIRITPRKLRRAMEIVQRMQKEVYTLYRLRDSRPQLIKDSHLYGIMNSFFFDDIEIWTGELARVNKELTLAARGHKSDPGRIHLLLTGSPVQFPNLKIPVQAEKLGATVTANETCLSFRMFYDPVSFYDPTMEGMLQSLMHRYVMACHCPSFVANRDREYRVRQLVEDFDVHGALYHVLRGCVPYDFEYGTIEKILGKPIIRVESDLSLEDTEQIRIRLEAFIEMIGKQRKKGA